MKRHPFNCSTFQTIWMRHFMPSETQKSFNCIEDLQFYKGKLPRLFINVGMNITNGNYYKINKNAIDHKGKVFLIYDVPGYFELEAPTKPLKVLKIPQYKGFLADLNSHDDFDGFFRSQFKSKSRYKYRRNMTRLEACFDTRYQIYHGDISREVYDHICTYLKRNLERRFGALGLENDILEKWDYYYELMYEIIHNKEGLLTVIYNGDEPIGVAFSFLNETSLFFAITSFNMDYFRFNLGHTIIIKTLEWCFEHGYSLFDFSKGQYDYKDRWTTRDYVYECHLVYDSKSSIATSVAKAFMYYYRVKQYMRDKNLNRLYYSWRYKLKANKTAQVVKKWRVIEEDLQTVTFDAMPKIDIYDALYTAERTALFDYMYGHPERVEDLSIALGEACVYVKGQELSLRLEPLS